MSKEKAQITATKKPVIAALCNVAESDTSAKRIPNSLILLSAF